MQDTLGSLDYVDLRNHVAHSDVAGFPLWDDTRQSVVETAVQLLDAGVKPEELADEVFASFEAADQELYSRVADVGGIIDYVLCEILGHQVEDFRSLIFTAFYIEVEELVSKLLDYLGYGQD